MSAQVRRGPDPEPAVPRIARRALLQGAGTLVGGALLSACGAAGAGTGPGANASSGGSSSGTGSVADGSGTVTVRDQRGQRITLAHPATRLVTIPMPAAAMLIAVDGTASHLVGMQSSSWAAMHEGILGQFFPEALSIAHNVADDSFAPNVESVLALHPDAVIQWGDEGTGITAPLQNAGLKVVGLEYGTQADVYTWIGLFAALLGKPERAKVLNAAIAKHLTEMTAVGRRAPQPAPKIVYFNQFTGGLKVAGNNSYNDFYITLVGGTNPASGKLGAPGQGMVGVDPEQVLRWDPDIVLLGNFDAAVPDDLYKNRVWQALTAVKNRRVYKVPLGGYRWDPPSQESPLMWRWLSMVAFPQAAPFDLRAEIATYYQLLYSHQPTSAQVDAILWSKVNDGSAHYQQFHAA